MADYSFAPGGGPKGFLGAYNFGIDTEKTLQDMGQKKQTHDLRMLQDRLNYDIQRAEEEQYGNLKRDVARRDLQDKDLLRDDVLERAKATTSQQVSQAEKDKRLLEYDTAKRKMDAMESAEAYLRSRGGERGESLPAPSDLDKSYEQTMEILRKGWKQEEIDAQASKGPQALVQWIQEGARAAKVDAPKLEEARKRMFELQKTELAHPPTADRAYPPANELGKLIQKPEWDAADKQAARGLIELVSKDIKESTYIALRSMQHLKLSHEEADAQAEALAKSEMRKRFPSLFERLGDAAPAEKPTPKTESKKEETQEKKGTEKNPVSVSTPAEAKALSPGTFYKGPDGKLRKR